ncbi:MAG TPA: GNAT family N-acetyltransferase [Verrucomicrobiota bacterium]|nr:GNAT family N-acetyltransferase [Verrucomicrobiota bacterium]
MAQDHQHNGDPSACLVRVRMVCKDLTRVPKIPVPDGFHLRAYQPGDAAHWTRIHLDAEQYHPITPATFYEKFGRDNSRLMQRQLYCCTSEGLPIGTATAWFDDDYYGEPWGRIHWVAVMREFQGLGLGRALVSRACKLLIELGHSRAYLATQAGRVRAIKIYRSLGFEPDIRTDQDREAWQFVPGFGGY